MADFLDTKVLLYLLSADEAKANRAEALIQGGGIVSVQVLNELVAVATGKLNMTMGEIREILATVRRLCAVVPLDLETHDRAIELTARHRFSIYDATMVAAALRADCTTLWTEDLHHGQKFQRLTIRNPFRA